VNQLIILIPPGGEVQVDLQGCLKEFVRIQSETVYQDWIMFDTLNIRIHSSLSVLK
jgi:hypothetical protein